MNSHDNMVNNHPFDAAAAIRSRLDGKKFETPAIALILGSGLGALADQITQSVTLPYTELPGFPRSTVHGHAGELIVGTLAGTPVYCMKGRGHFYEGGRLDTMNTAIRCLHLLGCTTMIATNAVGALHNGLQAGQLVAIRDHINLLPGSPLGGSNDERFGPRFFSMANAYDTALRRILLTTAHECQIPMKDAVYSCVAGPQFETPAEVNMLARFGADIVGMSVVPEVIAARHCGMRVLAVSAVTNMAEGLSTIELTHEHTLHAAGTALEQLTRLLPLALPRLAAH